MRVYVGAIVWLMLVAGLLAACGGDRWAQVEAGGYSAIEPGGAAGGHGVSGIDGLDVDRDSSIVTLALVDGSTVVARFTSRGRVSWPAGCPGNLYATRVEVLDLQVDELSIGPVTLARPILMRDCLSDPLRVVLRGDGEIGGSVRACAGAAFCIPFCMDGQVEGLSDIGALPHSMKGYELYSWRSGGEWRFTLITGTNRQKTLSEVASCRNETMDDWIKITVIGQENLLDLLAMLPRGSQVLWLNGPGLVVDDLVERQEMPRAKVVDGVRTRCADLGIDLEVGP